MGTDRFSAAERRLLLTSTGISEGVVKRLEEAGFVSLHQLRTAGVDQVVEHICRAVGSVAWINRRRALARAVECAAQATHRESVPCASQA